MKQALVLDTANDAYVDNSGVMLTPFYINESGVYELMPYDFIVDLVQNANIREPHKVRHEPGYWEKVREITHKKMERKSPFVKKTDLLEWVDLILTSKEIHDTIESVFHEDFKSNNAYFEAYLDWGERPYWES